MTQRLTFDNNTRDAHVLEILDRRKAVMLAALRICGRLRPGQEPSLYVHDATEFHLNGLLEEQDTWKSLSRLAYALACRIAPEYGVKLPWRIRLTGGWWV